MADSKAERFGTTSLAPAAMNTTRSFLACCGFLLMAFSVQADEPSTEIAPWDYSPACPTKKAISPPMFGDLHGFNFQAGGFNFQGTGLQFQGGFQFNVGLQFQGGFPIAVSRGAFKIAENESPRPQDRLFASYNYYNNVGSVLDVHRETIGFEKTLLGGNASIGLRLPFFQENGDGGFDNSEVGDLSVVFKYALINDADFVLSTGLVVTAPTGPHPFFVVFDGDDFEEVHPTLLQPYVGWFRGFGDFFVHGFSGVMVPTDSRDVTALFNDVAVGYWIDLDAGPIDAVVPTFEVHVTTPLNHRDFDDPPRFVDAVNLTTGCHFLLDGGISIGIAVGVPVTGPRLFDVEAIANISWFF